MASNVVYIAIQATSPVLNTNKTWNEINTVGGSLTNMLDEDGNATSWDFSTENNPTGELEAGLGQICSGAAQWVDEAQIEDDHQFCQTTDVCQYRFSDLDNDKTYTIETHGNHQTVDAAIMEFSLDNFGSVYGEIDNYQNFTEVFRFLHLSPTNGNIDIYWRMKSGETIAVLGAIKFEEDQGLFLGAGIL